MKTGTSVTQISEACNPRAAVPVRKKGGVKELEVMMEHKIRGFKKEHEWGKEDLCAQRSKFRGERFRYVTV